MSHRSRSSYVSKLSEPENELDPFKFLGAWGIQEKEILREINNYNPRESLRNWLTTVQVIFDTQNNLVDPPKKCRIIWARLDEFNKEKLMLWFRSTGDLKFESLATALLKDDSQDSLTCSEANMKLKELTQGKLSIFELVEKIETLVSVAFPKPTSSEETRQSQCAINLLNTVREEPYNSLVVDFF